MTSKKWYLPEVWFTVALFGLAMILSATLGLKFNLPSGDRAEFVGIHYLYPLIGVALWGCVAAFGQRKNLAMTFLVALPCYALVMICHFNIKLWAHLINPTLWDSVFWQLDVALHPIVDACMAIRRALAPVIPLEANFYMTAFIGMFYLSFCFHAVRDPHNFRTLFLAALIFQGLGALSYLVMPALGPFLYEQGVEPLQTFGQQGMLGDYHDMMAQGPAWVAANGSAHFTVGVGAMPSLHTGGSFLFLLFAWRYAKVLVPLYLMLFGFIVIDSIANRWHYLIDVPVGMLLALSCAWIAHKLNPRPSEQAATDAKPDAGGEFVRKLLSKGRQAAASAPASQ